LFDQGEKSSPRSVGKLDAPGGGFIAQFQQISALGERQLRNYRAICPGFAIVANISGRNSTADRLNGSA
jgi:hypothetical protein